MVRNAGAFALTVISHHSRCPHSAAHTFPALAQQLARSVSTSHVSIWNDFCSASASFIEFAAWEKVSENQFQGTRVCSALSVLFGPPCSHLVYDVTEPARIPGTGCVEIGANVASQVQPIPEKRPQRNPDEKLAVFCSLAAKRAGGSAKILPPPPERIQPDPPSPYVPSLASKSRYHDPPGQVRAALLPPLAARSTSLE